MNLVITAHSTYKLIWHSSLCSIPSPNTAAFRRGIAFPLHAGLGSWDPAVESYPALVFEGGLRLGAEYPACFALCIVILMCLVPISCRCVWHLGFWHLVSTLELLFLNAEFSSSTVAALFVLFFLTKCSRIFLGCEAGVKEECGAASGGICHHLQWNVLVTQ